MIGGSAPPGRIIAAGWLTDQPPNEHRGGDLVFGRQPRV